MPSLLRTRKNKSLLRTLCFFVAFSFFSTSVIPAYALPQTSLPAPNQFVPLSDSYSLPVLKGLKFDPKEPLKMEFIIDSQNEKKVTEQEASLLIKYFLAGLTIPAEDVWVNLSVYEQDKMTGKNLAETDLGKDLLSQDYLLKQISASLTYPDSETGKTFWGKIYTQLMEVAHTTKLPVNTYNKIWIMPDKAEVYEDGNTALVTEATLKTMLEGDYLALNKNTAFIQEKTQGLKGELISQINKISSTVTRDLIVPKINKDVNSGKNFANLRQIYYSLILASWFKQKFIASIYAHYINKGKTTGIDLTNKNAKDKIYNLYVEAFKKGLYNYTKIDTEPASKKLIKRQYYSGGCELAVKTRINHNPSSVVSSPITGSDSKTVTIELASETGAVSSPFASSPVIATAQDVIKMLDAYKDVNKEDFVGNQSKQEEVKKKLEGVDIEILRSARVDNSKLLNDLKIIENDYNKARTADSIQQVIEKYFSSKQAEFRELGTPAAINKYLQVPISFRETCIKLLDQAIFEKILTMPEEQQIYQLKKFKVSALQQLRVKLLKDSTIYGKNKRIISQEQSFGSIAQKKLDLISEAIRAKNDAAVTSNFIQSFLTEFELNADKVDISSLHGELDVEGGMDLTPSQKDMFLANYITSLLQALGTVNVLDIQKTIETIKRKKMEEGKSEKDAEKEAKKAAKRLADDTALGLGLSILIKLTSYKKDMAIISWGCEGPRDGSLGIPEWTILYQGKIYKSKTQEEFQKTLRSLKADNNNLKAYIFLNDALEVTNAAVEKRTGEDANSWAVAGLFEATDELLQEPPEHDAAFRTFGISYNSPSELDIEPFTTPLDFYKKLAETNGYNSDENSESFKEFMSKQAMSLLYQSSWEKELQRPNHTELYMAGKALENKYAGFKVLGPGDGDFVLRTFSITGMKLDGRNVTTFARSGSIEGALASKIASFTPNGHFCHIRVSPSATKDVIKRETAQNFSEAELKGTLKENYFDGAERLGFTEESLKQSYKGKGTPQNGVVSLTVVNDTLPGQFGEELAGLLKGVKILKDKNEKITGFVLNTMFVTPQGVGRIETTLSTSNINKFIQESEAIHNNIEQYIAPSVSSPIQQFSYQQSSDLLEAAEMVLQSEIASVENVNNPIFNEHYNEAIKLLTKVLDSLKQGQNYTEEQLLSLIPNTSQGVTAKTFLEKEFLKISSPLSIPEGEVSEVKNFSDILGSAYEKVSTEFKGQASGDEFVLPIVAVDKNYNPIGTIKDGDTVFNLNFRTDRLRELSYYLTGQDYEDRSGEVDRSEVPKVNVVTMTKYDAAFDFPVVLQTTPLENTYGSWIAKHGIKQMRRAEDAKIKHATHFLNGENVKAQGEDHGLVNSQKVPTYNSAPEMRAKELADAVIGDMSLGEYKDIFLNFANPDMLGHTGDIPAAIKGVETVDRELGRVVEEAKKQGYIVVILADHGNAEQMLNKDGSSNTAHTTNPVPFIIVGLKTEAELKLKEKGNLTNVAPTLLHLRGLDKPAEMDQESLIASKLNNKYDKILTIVLDGWGIREEIKGNAIKQAKTPNVDSYLKTFPSMSIKSSEIPSSEAGHKEIGAGRKLESARNLIDKLIKDGSFFNNEVLKTAMLNAKRANKKFHIPGLLSDGNVHSSMEHWFAVLEMAKQFGLQKDDVVIHAFLDGRDTAPTSAKKYLDALQAKCEELGVGIIADISGRYWGMDRENKWDRVKLAADALIDGKASQYVRVASSPIEFSPQDAAKFLGSLNYSIPNTGKAGAKVSTKLEVIFNKGVLRSQEMSFSPGWSIPGSENGIARVFVGEEALGFRGGIKLLEFVLGKIKEFNVGNQAVIGQIEAKLDELSVSSPITVSDNVGPITAATILTATLKSLDLEHKYFTDIESSDFQTHYLTPFMDTFYSVFGRYAEIGEVKEFYEIVKADFTSGKTVSKKIEFSKRRAQEFINNKIKQLSERVVLSLPQDQPEFNVLIKNWLNFLNSVMTPGDFSSRHVIAAIELLSEFLDLKSISGVEFNQSVALKAVAEKEEVKKLIIKNATRRNLGELADAKSFNNQELSGIFSRYVLPFCRNHRQLIESYASNYSGTQPVSQSYATQEEKAKVIAGVLKTAIKDLSAAASSPITVSPEKLISDLQKVMALTGLKEHSRTLETMLSSLDSTAFVNALIEKSGKSKEEVLKVLLQNSFFEDRAKKFIVLEKMKNGGLDKKESTSKYLQVNVDATGSKIDSQSDAQALAEKDGVLSDFLLTKYEKAKTTNFAYRDKMEEYVGRFLGMNGFKDKPQSYKDEKTNGQELSDLEEDVAREENFLSTLDLAKIVNLFVGGIGANEMYEHQLAQGLNQLADSLGLDFHLEVVDNPADLSRLQKNCKNLSSENTLGIYESRSGNTEEVANLMEITSDKTGPAYINKLIVWANGGSIKDMGKKLSENDKEAAILHVDNTPGNIGGRHMNLKTSMVYGPLFAAFSILGYKMLGDKEQAFAWAREQLAHYVRSLYEANLELTPKHAEFSKATSNPASQIATEYVRKRDVEKRNKLAIIYDPTLRHFATEYFQNTNEGIAKPAKGEERNNNMHSFWNASDAQQLDYVGVMEARPELYQPTFIINKSSKEAEKMLREAAALKEKGVPVKVVVLDLKDATKPGNLQHNLMVQAQATALLQTAVTTFTHLTDQDANSNPAVKVTREATAAIKSIWVERIKANDGKPLTAAQEIVTLKEIFDKMQETKQKELEKARGIIAKNMKDLTNFTLNGDLRAFASDSLTPLAGKLNMKPEDFATALIKSVSRDISAADWAEAGGMKSALMDAALETVDIGGILGADTEDYKMTSLRKEVVVYEDKNSGVRISFACSENDEIDYKNKLLAEAMAEYLYNYRKPELNTVAVAHVDVDAENPNIKETMKAVNDNLKNHGVNSLGMAFPRIAHSGIEAPQALPEILNIAAFLPKEGLTDGTGVIKDKDGLTINDKIKIYLLSNVARMAFGGTPTILTQYNNKEQLPELKKPIVEALKLFSEKLAVSSPMEFEIDFSKKVEDIKAVGQYFAVFTTDLRKLVVRNLRTGEVVLELGDLDAFRGFQLSETYLAIEVGTGVGSKSSEVRVYNLETGKLILKGLNASGDYRLTSTHLAVMDYYNKVTVYDLGTKQSILRNIDAYRGYQLTETHIAAQDNSNKVTVHILGTKQPILEVSDVVRNGFKLTKTHLAVQDSSDKVTVYNLNTKESILEVLDASGGYQLTETHIAVQDSSNKVTVHILGTKQPILEVSDVVRNGFKLTKTHLAVQDNSDKVTVYNLDTKESILEVLDASGGYQLTDTHLAVQDSSDKVAVYDLGTKQPILEVLEAVHNRFKFLKTNFAVVNSRTKVTVYNLGAKQPIFKLESPKPFTSLKFLETYFLFETEGKDQFLTIRTIYDLNTGKEIKDLPELKTLAFGKLSSDIKGINLTTEGGSLRVSVELAKSSSPMIATISKIDTLAPGDRKIIVTEGSGGATVDETRTDAYSNVNNLVSALRGSGEQEDVFQVLVLGKYGIDERGFVKELPGPAHYLVIDLWKGEVSYKTSKANYSNLSFLYYPSGKVEKLKEGIKKSELKAFLKNLTIRIKETSRSDNKDLEITTTKEMLPHINQLGFPKKIGPFNVKFITASSLVNKIVAEKLHYILNTLETEMSVDIVGKITDYSAVIPQQKKINQLFEDIRKKIKPGKSYPIDQVTNFISKDGYLNNILKTLLEKELNTASSPVKIIDGKKIAEGIREGLTLKVDALKKEGINPKIVTVLVGEDPASLSYINSKHRAANSIGLSAEDVRLPKDVSKDILLQKIKELNDNPRVHGILVQLPLPNADWQKEVIDAINPKKDVDGFSTIKYAQLTQQGFVGPVIESLKTRGVKTPRALIIGEDKLAIPIALGLVLDKDVNAIVSIVHPGSANLPKFIAEASVVIAAGIDLPSEKLLTNKIALKVDYEGEPLQIIQGKFLPCTPAGVMDLLKKAGPDLRGKHAVMVGRSEIVGLPTAILMFLSGADVTIAHSGAKNLANGLAGVTKEADVVVAAIGKPEMITADMIKLGAVIIDVGINRIKGKIVGDVATEEVKEKAAAITPVPGGVGPMTIAELLKNTVSAAEQAVSSPVEGILDPNKRFTLEVTNSDKRFTLPVTDPNRRFTLEVLDSNKLYPVKEELKKNSSSAVETVSQLASKPANRQTGKSVNKTASSPMGEVEIATLSKELDKLLVALEKMELEKDVEKKIIKENENSPKWGGWSSSERNEAEYRVRVVRSGSSDINGRIWNQVQLIEGVKVKLPKRTLENMSLEELRRRARELRDGIEDLYESDAYFNSEDYPSQNVRGDIKNKQAELPLIENRIKLFEVLASINLQINELEQSIDKEEAKFGELKKKNAKIHIDQVVAHDTEINRYKLMIEELIKKKQQIEKEMVTVSSPMTEPVGGIDMKKIDVKAAPSSVSVNMPIIDLEHFQGFTFRIIKMELIGGNFNTVLGGIFQKVEAHQRSLQGLAANELKANPIPADKPKKQVELAYAK